MSAPDAVDVAVSLRVGDRFTHRRRLLTFRDHTGFTHMHGDRCRFKVWNEHGNPAWVTVRATDKITREGLAVHPQDR